MVNSIACQSHCPWVGTVCLLVYQAPSMVTPAYYSILGTGGYSMISPLVRATEGAEGAQEKAFMRVRGAKISN